jgi:hypothetical protein
VQLANVSAARELGAAENIAEIEDVLVKHSLQPQLESIATLVVQPAENEAEARYACAWLQMHDYCTSKLLLASMMCRDYPQSCKVLERKG